MPALFAPALNGTAFIGMVEVHGPGEGRYVREADYDKLHAEVAGLQEEARLSQTRIEELTEEVTSLRELARAMGYGVE